MNCQLVLDGHISVGGDGCGCSDSSGVSNTVRGLSLECSSSSFEAIKSTDCAVQIATLGALGQNWAELPITLSMYKLLSLKSSAAIKLRIGAAPARAAGSGITYPATTLNTVTWDLVIDGTAFTVTFAGVSLTAAQVAAQVNARAITVGLSFLPASVDSNGQLVLTGLATGTQGSLVAAALAAVGFPDPVDVAGSGADLDVWGAFLVQFGQTGPSRIQVSGSAKIEILAAGTP
jgi:hypothetical protein